MSHQQLCFIALLPPQTIQDQANFIKAHFAEVYQSSHAQKSPPHITLKAPFKWEKEQLPQLKTTLQEFSQKHLCIPITLSGFGSFPPRVIYVHVLKTAQLLETQKALITYLEEHLELVDQVAKSRPFIPHLTVAFRDLTKSNFRKAWESYKEKSFEYQFTVNELTLLLHNGKHWEIGETFALKQCRN